MYYKRLPHFDYLAPKSVDQVLEMLGEHKNQARIMAGGTIVLHRMKERVAPRKYVVGLKGVAGLNEVRFAANKGLSVGAMASYQTIANSADVQSNYSLLARFAGEVHTPQIRAMATLGGNVASMLSTAQAIPILLVLGAQANIMTGDGEKAVSIGDMAGEIKEDNFLASLDIPVLPEGTRVAYQRYAVRDKYDWAVAAAAVAGTFSNGSCESIAIGLGGVPIRNARATEAEELLKGQSLNEETIEKAVEAAVQNRAVPGDEMFSSEYKKKVLAAMVRRALTDISVSQ